MNVPNDTIYSKFRINDNSFLTVSSRKCGPANGDGMVNCSDLETLRQWPTGKQKYVGIMIGGEEEAEWYSLPLEEFDKLPKARRNSGLDAYWLIQKEVLVPKAREVPVKAVSSDGKEIYFNSLEGQLTYNPKASTLHRALLASHMQSPFILQNDVVVGIRLK